MEIIDRKEPDSKKPIHPFAVFKSGLSLWRANFFTLCGISAVFFVPLMVLGISVGLLAPADPKASAAQAANLIVAAIAFIVSCYATIALILAVSEPGEKKNVMAGLGDSNYFFWPYIGTLLLEWIFLVAVWVVGGLATAVIGVLFYGLNHVLGFIVGTALAVICVALGVYFSIRLSMCGYSCVLEDLGPVSALKRSHFLVKQYVNPVIGTYSLLVLFYMLCYVPMFFFAFVFGQKQFAALSGIYQQVVNMILLPAGVSIGVALYGQLKDAVEKGNS